MFTAPFLRFFDFLRINNICVGARVFFGHSYVILFLNENETRN